MSDVCASSATPGAQPTEPDPMLRSLATEVTSTIEQLRNRQIPQQVGMVAACRTLALEVPRILAQQLEADVASGDLAQRWRAAHATAAASLSSTDDAALAAVALLLRDQGRVVVRYLARRSKDWLADSYRLEGRVDALEAHRLQLERAADHALEGGGATPAEPGPAKEG